MIRQLLLVVAAFSGTVTLDGCVSSTVRYGDCPVRAGFDDRRSPTRGAKPEMRRHAPAADRLLKTLEVYRGTPYLYGGMTRNGIDCSGLVVCVFRDLGSPGLPHSTRKLVRLGSRVPLARMRPGDLLFFRMVKFGRIDHVGISIGKRKFMHASTKLGVIESSLDDEYYRQRFVQARRVLP